jgi:type VI secretion system protein ImpL
MDQLAASPAPAPDPAKAASEEELQALRERFDAALTALKGSEIRRRLGGRWVYQLPWYLLIGPPGCGKTTALINSGLRFPLAERLGQNAVQGVGGTRNCDWWFTDEAVLIDTAGRYTTQDSYEQVDSAAWQGFLALLKKHRPRRPINGVLVAVSLADLMQQGQTERAAQARAIRQRVQELCKTFGIAIPVYLVFMKADLIAGFMEFFADLNKEGREQVWGLTFRYDPDQPAATALASFPKEREALAERLDQRLLTRMEDEREPGKRALVFSFPRQFNALAETLEQFVQDAFAPSRFEIHPLWRGVYFTSGTQTGTPIDRVLGAFADNFGFARRGPLPFKGTGKSFFLTRLLRDLIFVEAGLAGLNPRLERRRYWLRLGAYAGFVAAVALTGAAWTTSYSRNLAYIDAVSQHLVEIEARIDALPADELNPLGLLPLLDAARVIPGGFADRGEPMPLTMGLGLYQGRKLGSQAERAYIRILGKALLPRVILRLEEQIRGAGGDPDYLYDALRVYLMLESDEHYDAAAIQYWVGRDWQRTLPRETTTEQQESLRDHLSALLLRRPAPLPLDLDGELIADAREILNRTSPADRIYARLKAEGVGEDLSDFRITDVLVLKTV